jgi:hypothetical protein
MECTSEEDKDAAAVTRADFFCESFPSPAIHVKTAVIALVFGHPRYRLEQTD